MPFPKHLTKRWGKELGWMCQDCGRKWHDGWLLEAHHKIPTSMGGKNTKDNFRLLCIEHHERAHKKLAEMDARSARIVHGRLLKNNGRWR